MSPAQFRALRDAMGLTQPELGEAMGINTATVRRIETAAAEAVHLRDALAIERLAQLRGVEVGGWHHAATSAVQDQLARTPVSASSAAAIAAPANSQPSAANMRPAGIAVTAPPPGA